DRVVRLCSVRSECHETPSDAPRRLLLATQAGNWRGGDSPMKMTPADVLRMAQEHGARMVDFKFTDVPGTWQHFSIPTKALSESTFEEGIGFDGSSVRGFQQINESDML